MEFTKMQACGNDYVYVNCFKEQIENPQELAIKISNRNFGVGSDGLILIKESDNADFKMQMFNGDGSEAEMCGNGIRCVGKYVYDKGLTDKTSIAVETLAGIKNLVLNLEDGKVKTVTVDMGEPVFEPELIPVVYSGVPVLDLEVTALDKEFSFSCVSMGNPHAITYVEDVSGFPVEKYGSVIEAFSSFPKKTNVEFIEIIDRKNIKMRVWERGSGETMACGTGTCASVVASVLNGLCDRQCDVFVLGGKISILWNEDDNHIYMTGPAEFTFDGNLLI